MPWASVHLFGSPTSGHDGAPASSWWLAGSGVGVVVAIAITVAYFRSGHQQTSSSRRAAALGVATGVTWGFVASVIREFGSRLDHGLAATFTSWSPYVLVAVGLIAMVLRSNAVSAAPLQHLNRVSRWPIRSSAQSSSTNGSASLQSNSLLRWQGHCSQWSGQSCSVIVQSSQ